MRKFSSLADQFLVSGGNFLVVAICAHALSLTEQGKFTYVFASYMALLLLNVATIFQGAAVRAPAQEQDSYHTSLAKLQLIQAILSSLLVSLVWLYFGGYVGWQATLTEATLLFFFLLLQQLADFNRRSAYIFFDAKHALLSSTALYPVRILGLIAFRPETIEQVLLILLFSALIPALLTVFRIWRSWVAYEVKQAGGVKGHLFYSRFFIASAPLGWLWSYAPIFILGKMYGKEQVALLASIRGISNLANVLMEQIETKVVADWARLKHIDGDAAMITAASRLLRIGGVFWLFGMAVILMLGSKIVGFVLGGSYAPYWQLLVIGWIGYGVYFLARVSGIKHRALGSNQIEFVGNSVGVLTALAVGLLVIPEWQATGAAWVYVVIAAAMWGSQEFALKRVSGK